MTLLVSCAIATAQVASNTPSAKVPTNTLAIYLLAGERKPNLQDNKLEPKPVLADEDFLFYNTQSQQFAITAQAARRLCRKLQEKSGFYEPRLFTWSDTPFVLEALGERVYVGMFSTDTSSAQYAEIPVIKHESGVIGNPIDYVKFDIGFQTAPFPSISKHSSDPRNDKRVVEAVRRLFPVTNSPPKLFLK